MKNQVIRNAYVIEILWHCNVVEPVIKDVIVTEEYHVLHFMLHATSIRISLKTLVRIFIQLYEDKWSLWILFPYAFEIFIGIVTCFENFDLHRYFFHFKASIIVSEIKIFQYNMDFHDTWSGRGKGMQMSTFYKSIFAQDYNRIPYPLRSFTRKRSNGSNDSYWYRIPRDAAKGWSVRRKRRGWGKGLSL